MPSATGKTASRVSGNPYTITAAGAFDTDYTNLTPPASLHPPATLTSTSLSASRVPRHPSSTLFPYTTLFRSTINYVAGTLNVTPVALTITADSKVKAYGAGLPTFTASYKIGRAHV